MWIQIGKAFASVFLAALLGWTALTAVYLLPEEPMVEHTRTHKAVKYTFQCVDGIERGLSLWVDNATPSSAEDIYTDALMMNTALYPAETAPWQDALVNQRYADKKILKLADRAELIPMEFPVVTLQKYVDGETEGCSVEHYARYWNGYLLWLKPALYAFSFSTVRLANGVLQILLAFYLFTLLRERIGKPYGWAFLLAYLLLNPITLGMSFQFADMYYLGVLFSILLLHKEKWVEEGKEIYLLTAAGIATAYFDFLTYPLFSYGIPMTVALLLAHRKGLLRETWDGVKQVILGGIFWAIGYGGMYISKWALATALTDINVFADALGQLAYRMSHSQQEADWATTFGLGKVVGMNLAAWVTTPSFAAFAIFILGLLYTMKHRKKREFQSIRSVTLGLLLLCLSPFVWYAVLLNHSYLHYWFTFRELAIFAFAFAALLIVRTEEK